jgi:transcription elongation factor GreB
VVDQKPASSDRVYFGASVTLEDENQQTVVYRIVGPDEFDREPHYISVDSPLARSLLKRELGEEVEVDVPSGRLVYYISDIAY